MLKLLVADDDPNIRRLLNFLLTGWGYEVVVAENGKEALGVLRSADPPKLAILDWDMPEVTGPEVCKLTRENPKTESIYLIILTGKEKKQNTVAALDAGANDYVVKPFDKAELQARIRVGLRVVQLQESLAVRVKQLQESLDQIKKLKSLLPICAYCKKIRDDNDYWQQVDDYIMAHADIKFSHGICPTCFEKLIQDREKK